jgi:hypothetical protein
VSGAVLADVEARIAERVEARQPELELLVDQALERELAYAVETPDGLTATGRCAELGGALTRA